MADALELATLGALVLLIVVVLYRTREGNQLAPMFESNQKVTDTYQKMQDEYKEMSEVLTDVRVEITKSTEGRREVIDFSRDLRDVLLKPNIRGDVAEKLLEDMCKSYLPDSAWERQKVTDDEAGSQRGGVDVLLKTGSLDVPVDSKFPREAWKRYVNLIEQPMNGMKEPQQNQHRNAIKSQFADFQSSVMTKVGEIQKHINPSSGTTDFALMFIPTEAMYYAVVSDKNGLNEENLITRKGQQLQLLDAMLQENVIPVSPSTLYPFIHVILVGIQNMKVVENLESLQSRLTQFETKMRTFNTAYQGIGSALDNAKSAWDTAGSRYDELTVLGGRITNALEEVEVLDSATESLPEATKEEQVDGPE